jgi:hypothetical protein
MTTFEPLRWDDPNAKLTAWVIEHRLLAFLSFKDNFEVEQAEGSLELAYLEGFVWTPHLAKFIAGEWEHLPAAEIIAKYNESGLWVD